jgi:hypothetical protein
MEKDAKAEQKDARATRRTSAVAINKEMKIKEKEVFPENLRDEARE